MNQKPGRSFCRCRALAAILCLGPVWLAAAGDSPPSYPGALPAERYVLANLLTQGFIDVTANHASPANRVITRKFLEWLLTINANWLSHDGLCLANAVIEGPVNLSDIDVGPPVRFRGCHFTQKVDLTAAHFGHALAFEGCVFDGDFQANALRVDGSLELKPFYFNSWTGVSTSAPPALTDLENYLATNETMQLWSAGQKTFTLDTNRLVRTWEIDDARPLSDTDNWTNSFTATAWGRRLFLVQQYENVQAQASNRVIGLTVGPLTNQWADSLDLAALRNAVATSLETSVDFVQESILTTKVVARLQSVTWRIENAAPAAAPLVAQWWNAGTMTFFQPTVFRTNAFLNGANIGGKLDAPAVEFQSLGCHSLKVGDDLVLDNAHFAGAAGFIFAQSGHDCSLQNIIFEQMFDATGLNVGGSFLLGNSRFRADAHFDGVSVSSDFKGQYVRFENRAALVEFRGLQVGGFVDLLRAQFAGPVNFILANIKGDFEAQGATFEDHRSFKGLQKLTSNSFTFNTDFGSMQVAGFAVFENVLFARSVSFRNARFANLYLDGTHWPDAPLLLAYTDHPTARELLRLEGMDFESIRDVASGNFLHSYDQLAESHSNLLAMFGRRSPYSFDIYSKLENYFVREGAPALADEVYIRAKIREGRETTGAWAGFENFILHYTVKYGRSAWLAFFESVGIIVVGGWLAKYHMVVKSDSEKTDKSTAPAHPKETPNGKRSKVVPDRPGLGLALFYSLGTFLPFIDLGAGDLLEYQSPKSRFRYVMAFEKILGYVLVPLWTISLSGLIKS